MRRLIAAALAGSLLCAPLARAQETDTPESDLRCAIWSALAMSENEDPEISGAFSMALVWFLGRYEAATGRRFEDAATPEYIQSLVPDLEALDAECQPRMLQLGTRLENWGDELQNPGV